MAVRMGCGPTNARIMIVGEAYGADEERRGEPFVGTSGLELNRMLQEAGIMRSECYVTNVVNARPPNNDLAAWVAEKKKDITPAHILLRDKYVLPIVKEGLDSLLREIDLIRPNVIIACGNFPMWALTGAWGVLKWRGSLLRTEGGGKLIPIIHPAAVLRQWENRALCVIDLRRARKQSASPDYTPPKWDFIIRPNFDQTISTVERMLALCEAGETWLDYDIETRAGHIACIGLSWSHSDAICIPFMCVENKEGYWSVEEEAQIVFRLYKLLTHPNVRVRWQNGLYDAQYTYRHWHFVPRGGQDTMISQHALFCALPKGLSFLASMYSDHYVYWKDEGKTWGEKVGEDQLWSYNLQDCIYTRSVGEALQSSVASMNMQPVHDIQQELFWPVLSAMKRGIRIRYDIRNKLTMECQEELGRREDFIQKVLGHGLNPGSSVQMTKLFYEDLKQPPNWKRNKVGPSSLTCNDEALQTIATREPLLRPLINAISDIRTLGVFLSTFLLAKPDIDGRMRCSFNIGGDANGKSAPYSYRLSSSKNAFDSGMNLQNLPSDKSKAAGKAARRSDTDFQLPNIRTMFGPDPGFTFFDLDLDRADLQAMAWDADEPLLKAALKMGVDIHLLNVYVIDNQEPPPLEELVETHPRYPDHRGPRKFKREFAKVFAHATDYLGKARTVAAHTGRTVMEVERAQRNYLGRYRGIQKWQNRVIDQVTKHRFVENAFGYRWYIFDRIDQTIMPQAVAWICSSTVSVVINKAWINVHNNIPEVQVLGQVHDSLFGQFPTHKREHCLGRIRENASIIVPYTDPLIIPVGIKTSEVSWGDCQ